MAAVVNLCRVLKLRPVPYTVPHVLKPVPTPFVPSLQPCRPSIPSPKRSDTLRIYASSDDLGFDESTYVTATIEGVRRAPSAEGSGPVILLNLVGKGTVLSVYVGEVEADALDNGIKNKPVARPMTYDLAKNTFEMLGYKVVCVRINALVNNVYHARIHLCKHDGSCPVDVDARTSDAINLAVRSNARILVERGIAEKMGHPMVNPMQSTAAEASGGATASRRGHLNESEAEIVRTCKEECLLYKDPTVLLNLQLEMAVREENYEDASRIRDQIDNLIQSDQSLRLTVAIEKAVEDSRFKEAARLRDELKAMRLSSRTPHKQHPPQ